ncbi:MAG: TrkH family potassium uptake protein [Floccifex porci]|uniref:TrkH family potassium uptake protein n=1 Tax=Floccifex porci TaxID=2606629 RepID=UPI0023F380A5|nr:TrkH family potassium uptake protein [Floccifex porci]MCI7802853.1 TrkH family potassium uptake protein [Erysipelotrichaceae bacterium]MDD7467454.1 TrkH family potassium uptake protein [Floccifex porci]MDY4796332.1 TrkH family potassium uptake protein [Floccifex porci]
MNRYLKFRKLLTAQRIIIFGFLFVILTGTLFLLLPISRNESVSFIDALFTATSATCVTGLVVNNTATFWSSFGHVVILLLIQIGGMGVITLAILIGILSGKKIGLSSRSLMQESISAPYVGGIIRYSKFFIKGIFLIEIIGAVLLMFQFIPEYGPKGIWYSIFHSISAFCNAGFDLVSTPDTPGSLMKYAYNPIINTVICLLIVIGGIGFITWSDFQKHRFKFQKYSLQSKLVLVTTAILLLFPFLFFFFHEFKDLSISQRFWVSMFQSVTLRTAGFNTVDFYGMSEASRLIMILMMLVGGATGSTAGGMKVNTLAIIVLASFSIFFKRQDVTVFKRRIVDEIVLNALTIFMMYVFFFLAGGILLSIFENLPILTCLFESASALGTVGLTMGITSSLHTSSKIVLIILMYLGRVGGLTFIYATVSNIKTYSKLPQEKVTVG